MMHMKKKPKKILLKLCALLFFVLGIVTIDFYRRVPFTVSNRKAAQINYKLIQLRNQTLVYLPYELNVSNNRLQLLKLKGVYDLAVLDDISLDKNLIFTTDGVKIDISTRLNDNFDNAILPFTTAKFIYFKRHILANQNLNPISSTDIISQTSRLSSHSKIKLQTRIVDSLYQADEGTRFNVQFGDRSFSSTKFTKAIIGSEKQKQVVILDSLKGLSKKDAKKFLLKVATSDIRVALQDF